jgi:hypothetical protein
MRKGRIEKLTMNRTGDFVLAVFGNSHCGVQKNLKMRYAVRCECSAKLDARGFLFDQINVDNFFQKIETTGMSCEELAIYCTAALMDDIKRENPLCEIRKMSLTLSLEPYLASMTHEWAR